MSAPVDVLIPTYRRPVALAVTLAGLIAQDVAGLGVVVSDQSEDADAVAPGETQAVVRVLEAQGKRVEVHKNLPRKGMGQQRQFLLDLARAPYVLFLDDDLILEPGVIERMLGVIEREGCGFVGCAPVGLTHVEDVRPDEQHIEFFDGPVRREVVEPGSPAWDRHRLHNAANVFHLQRRLELTAELPRTYRVAWVGGCVLYDAEKLRSVGGFDFWRRLPSVHAGEDVLAQLKVMARFGGCGLLPSGVYHQELPTTLHDRRVDAPKVLL